MQTLDLSDISFDAAMLSVTRQTLLFSLALAMLCSRNPTQKTHGKDENIHYRGSLASENFTTNFSQIQKMH